METLLRFPPGKLHHVVRHVRRDPQFSPQLYFVIVQKDRDEQKRHRVLVSFEQVLWDPIGNKITAHVFLKQAFYAPAHTLQCAVDEKEQRLHILYDSRIELMFGLSGFPLEYEKPDKFGYRRISVPIQYSIIGGEPTRCSFTENAKGLDISTTAIYVFPSTDQLIIHCKILAKSNGQVGFLPCLSRVRTQLEMTVTMLNAVETNEMEARSHVFSRTNDLLTLISYHSRCPPINAEKKAERDKTLMLLREPDGFIFLYSHNSKLQPINTLQIDPVQLVQSFLPRSLFIGLKASAPDLMPDFMFFGAHLQLLGHVHKYVLFFFHHNYVFAAKWPKDWYKLKEMPKVQQKRVLCVDKQKKHGDIVDVWVLSTDLFFKVDQSGAEAVRKMSLGKKLKDYRRCAFCGEEEKGKKLNSKGKRVSRFKVCRLCKERGLHKCHTDGSADCHYCSFECIRRHWRQHKLVHIDGRKQRK